VVNDRSAEEGAAEVVRVLKEASGSFL
jgi:hypothetical protein